MSWFLSQLVSYGFFTLLAVVVCAYVFARKGGWPAVILGHLGIAALIIVLDIRWIQEEMSRSDWNGSPDMDIIFSFGVFLRILLINTLLLPISLLGTWHRERTNGLPSV